MAWNIRRRDPPKRSAVAVSWRRRILGGADLAAEYLAGPLTTKSADDINPLSDSCDGQLVDMPPLTV